MMVRAVIDEFFMLGANAPAVLRLLALGNRGDELIARFNDGIFAVRNSFCAHARGLEMSRLYCQKIPLVSSASR